MTASEQDPPATFAHAGVAAGSDTASSVTVYVRSYLSSQHLWAARHFARLAADLDPFDLIDPEAIRHRAYVISAVMESAAFVESTINELLADAHDHQAGFLDEITHAEPRPRP